MPSGFIRAVILICVAMASGRAAAPITFKNVTMRRALSPEDRRLIQRKVDLIFDDANAMLTVETHQIGAALRANGEVVPAPFRVKFDEIAKVVLDATQTRNGASVWHAYFERKPGATPDRFLFSTQDPQASELLATIRQTFGARVEQPHFEPIGKASGVVPSSAGGCPYRSRDDASLPEIRPDKALVVIVSAQMEGNVSVMGFGRLAGVLVNGHRIGANHEGSYSFTYLDPGVYRISSTLGKTIYETRLTMDSGQGYYFIQNRLRGGELSRHSREYVMFEAGGAYYSEQTCSDWKAGTRGFAELVGYVGLSEGSLGGDKAFGGGIGVNITSLLQLFLDGNYLPTGPVSYGGVNRQSRFVNLSSGLQFRASSHHRKAAPYLLAGGGFGDHVNYRTKEGANRWFLSPGITTGIHGFAVFGGGVRTYVGRDWGFRPELRIHRYFAEYEGGPMLAVFTFGIFYQSGH